MRYVVIIILFLTSSLIFAQNNALVIYIDASSSDDKLNEIIAEVQDIVDSKLNSDILLFISNGERPIVTNTRSEVSQTLRRLKMISPPYPGFKDVERLNKEIISYEYLSRLSKISSKNGIDNLIEFHFYFDKTDYYSLQLKKKIIKPFLFSNNLKFKESLQENCSVYLHLGIKDDIDTPDINEKEFETTEYK